MTATSAKPVFTMRLTGDLNEREVRKLFFVATVDVNDQTLSHLVQPLVRIALKILQLFRAHRVTHTTGDWPYVPPHDVVQNDWMANDHDLVVAVQELDVEFTTQYVKDKIDSTLVQDLREIQPIGQ
jgi:hypothetical protein